jgi:hypothetical protein
MEGKILMVPNRRLRHQGGTPNDFIRVEIARHLPTILAVEALERR